MELNNLDLNNLIEKALIPILEAGEKVYLGCEFRWYLNLDTKDIVFEKMINNKWIKLNTK
jgi:hypothetical protein